MLGLRPALFVFAGTAFVTLAGCDGDTTDPADEIVALSLVAGDGQSATAGNRLSIPLSIAARNSSGDPISRVRIDWTVVKGNGAILSSAVSTTDGNGVAMVSVTLGDHVGEYLLQAESDDAEKGVSFSADAVAPPVLTGVSPQELRSGDQAQLRGTGLSDSVYFYMSELPAELVDVSASGTSATIRVPPCLPDGVVEITAEIGLTRAAPVTAMYVDTTTHLSLDPGEIVQLHPDDSDACRTLPAPTGAEEAYLVIVQSTASPSVSAPFRLAGVDDGPVARLKTHLARERTQTPAALHDHLRQWEREWARRHVADAQPSMAAIAVAVAAEDVPTERTFRVCSIVTCSADSDFVAVQATAVAIGDQVVLYRDNGGTGSLDTALTRELASLFDDVLYDVATNAFGAESDLDQNGRVAIVLTPVVNRMTPDIQCLGSFVTGFFHPIDLDPSANGDARSNQGEVFYTLVPDPDGTHSCPHTRDQVKNIAPVTFIHEYQHMISFFQHVVLRGGAPEENWLNEGLSHLAEDLAAVRLRADGDEELASKFVIANLYNGGRFLEEPAAVALMFDTGYGGIRERGAGWLFLRWLVDQYGDTTPRRLVETSRAGVANVEDVTGASMSVLLPRWFLSTYLAGQESWPQALPAPYREWDLGAVYASLHEQDPFRFPRPFPLVPRELPSNAFYVDGTLRAGTGEFFVLPRRPGAASLRLHVTRPDGTPLQDEIGAVVTVARIR